LVQTDEERKARRKEQRDRPEAKAKRKKYNQRPEVKAKKKEHNQRPEVKARITEYHSRPENVAKRKKYSQSLEGKLKKKEHYQRPGIKAKMIERNQRPEVRAKVKIYRDVMRVKVLQYYSKHLSKSNIPCCRCCGLNSHIAFLALDHIAGRHQMDSEPELVKLGYSSKMISNVLLKWIIDNNFPKGFQILCHNCNLAKGYYGKCPHERK